MTKTLLIIGAGTSMSIHSSFPSGIQLANLIDVHLITTKKKTHEKECPYISPMINEAFRIFKPNINAFDKTIDKLKVELWAYVQEYYYNDVGTGTVTQISVDNLISDKFNNNTDITNLAKHCIAYHLKGQENAYIRKINSSGHIKADTWVDHLFTLLHSRGWSYDDIQKKFRVISFNYERLFEYLSCKAIKKTYNEDLNHLQNIEYIYGRIGSLADVPFEDNNDVTDKMKDCFKKIMLIGERNNIANKPQLDTYEKVLFVGFGYDKNNLTDTLSINLVKKAKLLGMCRNKSKLYQDVERDYKINITTHKTIEDFLNENL
ncbi:MAG: hypothetical protein IM638_04800 [Bacteroidetes bacterium]|nr:hypothetical protein [Bacteroidota bacterium]